jgi:hypothetical protein
VKQPEEGRKEGRKEGRYGREEGRKIKYTNLSVLYRACVTVSCHLQRTRSTPETKRPKEQKISNINIRCSGEEKRES